MLSLPRVLAIPAIAGLALTLALAAPAAAKKKSEHAKVEETPRVERVLDLMGRTLHMTADGHDSASVGGALGDGIAAAVRVESAISPDFEDAEIARINRG